MRTIMLFSLVLMLTQCTYMRPRIPGTSDPRSAPVGGRLPLDTMTAQLPVDTATGIPYPGSVGGGGKSVRERRICRTERVPDGWVIRAYETRQGPCPGGTPKAAYNVAVIDWLPYYHYGDEIAICADQRIPSGWRIEEKPAECPGARVQQGARTGLVIRKI